MIQSPQESSRAEEVARTGTTIVRASFADTAHARLLLEEYYEAVGVVQRDTLEQIKAFLSDPAAGLWIAYVGEVPSGCVVLRPLAVPARAAECKRLYVRPCFRGCGIAGNLLAALEACALALGMTWVYLDSKDDLPEALRIYLRRGYRECERYNDNPQATIFLRKNLGVVAGQ